MPRLNVTSFGGGNWNDPPELLVDRAYQGDGQGGFNQQVPLEASSLENVDFKERSLTTRLGSALLRDLGSNGANVLVASEILVDGTEFNGAGIVVGQLSMYTNQSGSWARLNNSGSTAYSHAATVTRCSFAKTDGHLFIGLSGANSIQVWKAGADLDAAMNNGNTYEQIYGSNSTITGTWGTGYYIVREFHGRLLMCTGNTVVEYTDINQPWDRADGGIRLARDSIVAIETFTPRGGNELTELCFFFTASGPDKLTGFNVTDTVERGHGLGAPLSHRAVVACQGWLLYLTEEGTIIGINGQGEIDLGRRLRDGDGTTGPADLIDPTNSNHVTLTFGFYDEKRKQALWFHPQGAIAYNSHAVGVDFQLGEPYLGEPRETFERKVRMLYHSLGASTAWFVGMFQISGAIYGVTANGNIWTHNSGRLDFDSVTILDSWVTPELTMGQPTQFKSIRRLAVRVDADGDWNLYVDIAKNRQTAYVQTYSVPLLDEDLSGVSVFGTAVYDTSRYVVDTVTAWATYIDRYVEAIRLRFKSQETARYWTLRAFDIQYEFGHRSD